MVLQVKKSKKNFFDFFSRIFLVPRAAISESDEKNYFPVLSQHFLTIFDPIFGHNLTIIGHLLAQRIFMFQLRLVYLAALFFLFTFPMPKNIFPSLRRKAGAGARALATKPSDFSLTFCSGFSVRNSAGKAGGLPGILKRKIRRPAQRRTVCYKLETPVGQKPKTTYSTLCQI